MRKITEIRKELAELEAKIASLNAAENGKELQEALDRYDAVSAELRQAEIAERKEQEDARRKMEGEAKKGHMFSLLRFIQGVMNGRMDGIEADYAAIGEAEYSRLGLRQNGFVIPSIALSRAASGQNAGTAADGGNLVITTQRYVEDVKQKLVVAGMGATVLNGLVGNVDLPSVGGITASFLAEAATSAPSKKAVVSKVTLTPRGCRASMVTTRDLMKQTSLDVDRILIDRLSDAAAACLDKEALAAIVAAATSAGTAFSWATVVAMETAINTANANRGRMGYVLPTALWGAAKTTVKDSSGAGGFILDRDNTINGYKADYSNQFAAKTPVFGNFADLFLGNWGGIDVVVNPFSLDDTGEIKLSLFYYADAKVALDKSFSKLVIPNS